MSITENRGDSAWAAEFLQGGGEMGALMRSVDWARTPVGSVENWPSSLKAVLGLLLSSESALCVLWAPELVQFYNDGFRPILGSTKHPQALGQPARECWSEVWTVIAPLYAKVLAGGSTLIRGGLLVLERHGFLEECYFDYSYSALRDDASQIGGILAICSEVTDRVLNDRRLRALGQLGARSLDVQTPELACRAAATVLADVQADLPFALMYLLDEGDKARLIGSIGVAPGDAAAPLLIRLGEDAASWPLHDARRFELELMLETLPFAATLSGGPWPEAPRRATVLPLKRGGDGQPHGFLVAGISPRLPLDDAYRDFLRLIATHLAGAIQQALSFEQEKRRAETLAELDRAKTAFFSNVSHEFRTPLTLIIGPLEDMLAKHPEAREQLELAHRNSLRLLKLVNMLLDFSRIEAGRIEASYQPTDLSALTVELASNFRSAIEGVGMTLSVECDALPEPVYIDREMWEKIVLNLLSNAFKFTLEGGIGVFLHAVDGGVELEVRDSGPGIPVGELQKVFDRFHRVKGAVGRSHEGSGIGLALVRELARLQGGTVGVRSEVGRGSAFTVRIPLGNAHLPQEQVQAAGDLGSPTAHGDAFVQEALRWLPASADAKEASVRGASAAAVRQRILLADDNADLRDYVRRLLEETYEVEVVGDGLAALEAARARPPDLIVSDIMMPKLDGVALIRELRADPVLGTIPVIVLSARAGEEARLEGLSHGADDYLVKPFSARDLLGRVASALRSEGMRRRVLEQERRFRALVQASSDVVYSMSPDWSEMRYLEGRNLIVDTPGPSRSWVDKYIHPDDQVPVLAVIRDAIVAKKTFELEHRVLRLDGTLGWTFSRAIPILDPEGTIAEWLGAASDITPRKEAENALREAARRKDEFLATLSHELRNPLAPLRNGLELMRLQGSRPNPAVQDIMDRQLNHLVRLVDDLLEMSRITQGTLELRRERVELATIVRNAIETSQPLIQAGGHRLDVSLPGEALWLEGDPVRLTQVLGNLLNNSAQYTDNGGIITLSAWREQATAVLSVRDNGCGITADGIERIFDMFNRELHVTQRPHGGLGIGLTLSRRLVEMHGGLIEARSPGEGLGSEFLVRLPLASHAAAAAATMAPAAQLLTLHALVVDDNQDAASTLGALLEAMGAEVDVVNDGPSAIDIFAARNHSVVLLDIGMPVMDGHEVAIALRTRFPDRRPTIIALTGWGQPEDRRRAREAGIDHYLVKPLQFDLLKDILFTPAKPG